MVRKTARAKRVGTREVGSKRARAKPVREPAPNLFAKPSRPAKATAAWRHADGLVAPIAAIETRGVAIGSIVRPVAIAAVIARTVVAVRGILPVAGRTTTNVTAITAIGAVTAITAVTGIVAVTA